MDAGGGGGVRVAEQGVRVGGRGWGAAGEQGGHGRGGRALLGERAPAGGDVGGAARVAHAHAQVEVGRERAGEACGEREAIFEIHFEKIINQIMLFCG